jgi:hypothetical protein
MHAKSLLLAAAFALLCAGSVQARPYLMLSADSRGFQAMDLSGVRHDGVDSAEATLITAPLTGAPDGGGDKLAPLVETRVTVDCAKPRWKVTSTAWTDAKEVVLSSDPSGRDWTTYAPDDLVWPKVQDAACLNRFTQQMVSRTLNLGQILANYQRAWGKTAPEPLTDDQLQKQKYQNAH